MTFEEAKQLHYGQVVYEVGEYNVDGTARRWQVKGKAKTWKRSPDRVSVPIRHGMYNYGYINEGNFQYFTLTEPLRRSRRE